MSSTLNKQTYLRRANFVLSAKKSSLQRLEFIFATAGLLFYVGTLTGILSSIGLGITITLLRYTIFLTSTAVLLIDFKATKETLARGKFLWPLVMLAIASVIWSRLPLVTLQSLRSDFIPITTFGIYLSTRFNRKELFEMLYSSLIITAAVSLFYVLFIPSIGKHPASGVHPGAWRGIFSHKNTLGTRLTMAGVFAGIKLLYSSKRKLINTGILFLIYVEILFSKSATALVLSTSIIFLIWTYKQFRWRGKSTVLLLDILILFSTCLIGAIIGLWTPLLELLDKDPTLSGRTLIWRFLLEQRIPQAPILGYGKDVFWKVPALFSSVYESANHLPSHAHNGYIELLVDLGFVGLIFFIISLVLVLTKVFTLAYQAVRPEDVWPLATMIIILSTNIVESALLYGANFFWILYILIACMQSKTDQDDRALPRT